eukprot:m51a1_g4980 hypothetical protein (173) ;mRNA; f:33259-35527
MQPTRAVLALAVVLAAGAAATGEWEGCETSDECAQTVPGKKSCCHAGDRRCLTMDSCAWANKVDKTNRNCDCITNNVRGHAPHWGDCVRTSDCDVGVQALYCHKGDRRCLTDADCKWANYVDHKSRDCAHVVDHCFNGVHDYYPDGDLEAWGNDSQLRQVLSKHIVPYAAAQ